MIISWIENIKLTYNVNPVIFAVIYLLGVPPFWYSLYKIVRSLKKGDTSNFLKWIIINGISIIAPFVYVAIWGKNLPGWVWFVFIAIIVVSAISLIKNIKTQTSRIKHGTGL